MRRCIVVAVHALLAAALPGCAPPGSPPPSLVSKGTPFDSVAMVSADHGWIGGDNGALLRYAQGSWGLVASPTKTDMRALAMVSADEGWAAGFNGALFHYHNGAWASAASPIAPAAGQFTTLEIETIAMVSAEDGWAVGGGVDADGFLLHYDGAQWTRAPSPVNNHLSGVAMLSADEGWAVGWGGALLQYHAGTWTPVHSPTTKDLIAVAIVSADEAWAVGDGVILREQGGVWTQTTTAEPLFESVALTGPGEGWAVGEDLNAGAPGAMNPLSTTSTAASGARSPARRTLPWTPWRWSRPRQAGRWAGGGPSYTITTAAGRLRPPPHSWRGSDSRTMCAHIVRGAERNGRRR